LLDRALTYAGWYAVRFAPYSDDDANLYAWCVATLRRVGRELGCDEGWVDARASPVVQSGACPYHTPAVAASERAEGGA
jgi:hypothetical protein